MRISHKRSPRYDKKSRYQESTILNKDRLMRINKSVLMRINKPILLRNENDNRFHSYDSQVFLTTRTQSATIPIFANRKALYIYKKWNCVESLTIPGSTLTVGNRFAIVSTSINFQQAY